MPVRFLSDAELARLSSWPDESAEHDLVTFFTLTNDDAAWLSGNVRVENRLGAAVQLCTLPWLGWIPDDLTGCRLPRSAVSAPHWVSRRLERGVAHFGVGNFHRAHQAFYIARCRARPGSPNSATHRTGSVT